MARIPDWFIDQVRQQTDLVALIAAHAPLKKVSSDSYSACCPFHDEKTPSFYVTPSRQLYHCFGCGASGTAITFAQEYLRLSFVDAVEYLAKQLGMDVPREQMTVQAQQAYDEHKAGYEQLTKIAQLYGAQLKGSSVAIDYLKSRGVDGHIAKRFQLGYATPSNDLVKQIQSHQLQRSFCLAVKLVVQESDAQIHGRAFDRFRNRIMFPIRATNGQVVGFGGRLIGQGKPKYLNSSESDWFHKSQLLYGLYEAKQHNRQLHHLLIVEGYMDVVALHQGGYTSVVATLGTAIGESHLKQLFQWVPKVVFAFDGDKAGLKAAQKAFELSLQWVNAQRQVSFFLLPADEDPDSFMGKVGLQAFEQALAQQSLSLSAFMSHLLLSAFDPGTPESKSALLYQAKIWLQQVTDVVFRVSLVYELASLVNMTAYEVDRFLQLGLKIPYEMKRVEDRHSWKHRLKLPHQLPHRLSVSDTAQVSAQFQLSRAEEIMLLAWSVDGLLSVLDASVKTWMDGLSSHDEHGWMQDVLLVLLWREQDQSVRQRIWPKMVQKLAFQWDWDKLQAEKARRDFSQPVSVKSVFLRLLSPLMQPQETVAINATEALQQKIRLKQSLDLD